jgi:hypothetical protein
MLCAIKVTALVAAAGLAITTPVVKAQKLSGVGFNALNIDSSGNAFIDGGTYDASDILAGIDIDTTGGGEGLLVDINATATICNVNLIKGGRDSPLDGDGKSAGRPGISVVGSLEIVNGFVEGGDAGPDGTGPYAGIGDGGTGIQLNDGAQVTIDGHVTVLGGFTFDGSSRGVAIMVESFSDPPSVLDVFSGTFGDELTETGLTLIGENITVNIYGGQWYGAWNSLTPSMNDTKVITAYGDLVWEDNVITGHLCDNSRISVEVIDIRSQVVIDSDCSNYISRASNDKCETKTSKSGKSRSISLISSLCCVLMTLLLLL